MCSYTLNRTIISESYIVGIGSYFIKNLTKATLPIEIQRTDDVRQNILTIKATLDRAADTHLGVE